MSSTKDALDVTASSVHLDAIRGAAALAVFLGHTRDFFFTSLNGNQSDATQATAQQSSIPLQAPAQPRINMGNEAVMIFFVLSGYLVGGSVLKALRRDRWSWKDYLIKRLTRLWVVLIPALILGVALDYAGLHHFSTPDSIYAGPAQQELVRSGIAERLSVPVIAGNAVFLQTILVSTAGTNESLWSLANEFWYYISFPLLLLALKKNQSFWLRALYLLATACIVLLVGKEISLLFFVWVLGAALSVMPLVIPLRASRILLVPLAILLPVVFVGVRRAGLPMYGAQWMVALYSALLIYVVLHQVQKARAGIYQSVAAFFSRISYTLYLVHLPVAVFLCALINSPWHRWPKSPRNLMVYLAFNVALVLVSYLFYLAFEGNTEKVRLALFHRPMREKHLPTHLSTE